MWIKEIAEVIHTIYQTYGVKMLIDMATTKILVFRMQKGDFRKMVGFGFENIFQLNEEGLSGLEDYLMEIAKEVADAYDSTNKSKAWNETLQEIGVREE